MDTWGWPQSVSGREDNGRNASSTCTTETATPTTSAATAGSISQSWGGETVIVMRAVLKTAGSISQSWGGETSDRNASCAEDRAGSISQSWGGETVIVMRAVLKTEQCCTEITPARALPPPPPPPPSPPVFNKQTNYRYTSMHCFLLLLLCPGKLGCGDGGGEGREGRCLQQGCVGIHSE